MPKFEVLDARIASALNKIIHNSQFKRKISLEEQKAQKQDRFLWGRQISYLIYDQFRVTGANDSVENFADLFTIVLRNDDIQEFDSKWDGILSSMTKIAPVDILEGFYKSRIRESEKVKTVLELYELEIHQKKLGPVENWWREVSSRKFEIRILGSEMEMLRRTLWSRIREQNSVYKEFLEIFGNVLFFVGSSWVLVRNPQPPVFGRHRCTVGFDRDPPVWHSHPGRMMGASERQLFLVVEWLLMDMLTWGDEKDEISTPLHGEWTVCTSHLIRSSSLQHQLFWLLVQDLLSWFSNNDCSLSVSSCSAYGTAAALRTAFDSIMVFIASVASSNLNELFTTAGSTSPGTLACFSR